MSEGSYSSSMGNRSRLWLSCFGSLIVNALKEFLTDNMFATSGRRVFNRQSAYIWIQTVLLFLPTCSFIYKGFSRKRKANPIFNFTFCYIDDFLSLHNAIYPIEHEINDITDTDRSASYLDLHLEIDIENRLRTKLCDKRHAFNFPL